MRAVGDYNIQHMYTTFDSMTQGAAGMWMANTSGQHMSPAEQAFRSRLLTQRHFVHPTKYADIYTCISMHPAVATA